MAMRSVDSTAQMIPIGNDRWLLKAEAEGMAIQVEMPHAVLVSIHETVAKTANVSAAPEHYANGNIQRFLASMIASCIEVHIQSLELFFHDKEVTH